MVENDKDLSEHELFVTEFPKQGFGIVDYLQGRVHFALLDQIKLMSTSGMSRDEIKQTILANVTEIIDKYDPNKDNKN